MSFTDTENYVIVFALYVTSALGVLGSAFTITTFLLFREARNAATSLVFCNALTDFIYDLSLTFYWMWLDTSKPAVCDVQGTLVMFGLCASIMWGLMIGISISLILFSLRLNIQFIIFL